MRTLIPAAIVVAVLASAADAFAGLRPDDVTLPALPDVMLRQETALPPIAATAVTVSVRNSNAAGGAALFIQGATLTFSTGATRVTTQFTIGTPALSQVAAGSSQALVFQVTPGPNAVEFMPVTVRAAVTAIDVGTGKSATQTATGSVSITGGPSIVLGQIDFTSTQQLAKGLSNPSGVCSTGTRLFVADTSNNRVLIWSSIPATNNRTAGVVLGQPDFATTAQPQSAANGNFFSPTGVYSDGQRLYVADSGFNRVQIWSSVPSTNNRTADLVLGQPGFTSSTPNNGGIGASTLARPEKVTVAGSVLFRADTANIRVLGWSSTPTSNFQGANVVVGQTNFSSVAPSACTLSGFEGGHLGIGSDGPKFFVADSSGNRVLQFNAIPSGSGTAANVQIGASNCAAATTTSSLSGPVDVSAHGGRVFVADSGNNRILIFNSVPSASSSNADLVLGQGNFNQGGDESRGLRRWDDL